MSIIHEALKKVQMSLQKTPAPVVEQLPPDPYAPKPTVPLEQELQASRAQSESRGKARKSGPPVLLLTVLAVLAAAAWFMYRPDQNLPQMKHWLRTQQFRLNSVFTHPAKPEPRAILIPAAADPTAETSPSPAASSQASVILNVQGTMTNNGSTVALINDKIYEVGEEINGMKISAITANTITVERNGRTETLPIKR